MTKRKIGTSYRSVTGTVPSTKEAGGKLHYESTLERDLLIVLDFWPDVMTIESQPVTLRYRSSKRKTVPYTPDIHARFFPGSSDLFGHENCIVEVKYQADLDVNGAEYEERFEVARHWAAERGMKFLVLTETEIRTPLLDNALLLGPTLSFPNRDEALVSRIKTIVCCARGCTIKHVIDRIGGEQSLTRRHIFHLIQRGALYVEDYRQLITERSVVRGTFEDLYHD